MINMNWGLIIDFINNLKKTYIIITHSHKLLIEKIITPYKQ
jgi:hypothetical protein